MDKIEELKRTHIYYYNDINIDLLKQAIGIEFNNNEFNNVELCLMGKDVLNEYTNLNIKIQKLKEKISLYENVLEYAEALEKIKEFENKNGRIRRNIKN